MLRRDDHIQALMALVRIMWKLSLVAINFILISTSAKAGVESCEAIAKRILNEQVAHKIAVNHKVVGSGRLYFYTSPDGNCRSPNIFVIPNDMLAVHVTYRGWSFVEYVNPKTGKKFRGWVNSDRLAISASNKQGAPVAGQNQSLIRLISKGAVVPMPRSKIWGRSSYDDIDLKLNYKAKVRPVSLVVGLGHPNGMRVLAHFGSHAVSLPLSFPDPFEGFNEYGDINEGYYIQVAEHDFDQDGEPEIIVAAGDGMMDLAVNIIKYHPPYSPKDATRLENWGLVGSFDGQKEVHVERDTITLPYGSHGAFKEYTWVKGKFVETN